MFSALWPSAPQQFDYIFSSPVGGSAVQLQDREQTARAQCSPNTDRWMAPTHSRGKSRCCLCSLAINSASAKKTGSTLTHLCAFLKSLTGTRPAHPSSHISQPAPSIQTAKQPAAIHVWVQLPARATVTRVVCVRMHACVCVVLTVGNNAQAVNQSDRMLHPPLHPLRRSDASPFSLCAQVTHQSAPSDSRQQHTARGRSNVLTHLAAPPLSPEEKHHNINQTSHAGHPASTAATDRSDVRPVVPRCMCGVGVRHLRDSRLGLHAACAKHNRGNPCPQNQERMPTQISDALACLHEPVSSECAQSPTTAVLTVADLGDLGESAHNGSQGVPDPAAPAAHTLVHMQGCSGRPRAKGLWLVQEACGVHAADKQHTAASFAAIHNTQSPCCASLGVSQRQTDSPSTQKKRHSAESVKEKERETAQAKANGRPNLPAAKTAFGQQCCTRCCTRHLAQQGPTRRQALSNHQSLPHTPGRALAGKHAGWTDTPRGFTEARTKGAGKCSGEGQD